MPTKNESRELFLRQIINIVAYVAVLVIAVVGVSLPYNDNYMSDVVSRYNPDFMVSGYVYYVFGVVLAIALLTFVVYQANSKRMLDKTLRAIDHPFWIALAAHVVFVFAFYYDMQWLAFIGMIVESVAVFFIYFNLGVGKTHVNRTFYWCVHFPFSILAAATIFNFVSVLVMFCIRYNLVWWGVSQCAWTVMAFMIIGYLTTVLMHYRFDIAFATVLLWFASGFVIYQSGHDPIITGFAYLLTFYYAFLIYTSVKHPRVVRGGTK